MNMFNPLVEGAFHVAHGCLEWHVTLADFTGLGLGEVVARLTDAHPLTGDRPWGDGRVREQSCGSVLD